MKRIDYIISEIEKNKKREDEAIKYYERINAFKTKKEANLEK